MSLLHNIPVSLRHLLDHVILHSLLLCLIARDTHLIIRTPEEDIGLVTRLVAWTLSSVFDYTTHRLKIRHKPSQPANGIHPNNFLRSLFLPSFPSSNRTSQDESSDANRSRNIRKLPSRSRSRPMNQPHSARSISFPADLSAAAHSHVDNLSQTNSATGHHVRTSATIFRGILHAQTDPLPSHRHHNNPNSSGQPGNKPLPQLPRGLVISGLENAGASSQRALAEVLAQKRILFDSRDGRRSLLNAHQDGNDPDADEFEGLWNLPDGFIVVYVCPIDSRERPQIHKSLLDKFSMSCNVLIKPSIRYALQSMPLSSTRSNSNPSTPLPSPHMSLPPTHTPPYSSRPLPQPQQYQRQSYHSPNSSHPLLPLPDPILPPSRIQSLHQAGKQAHLSPVISLYLADLFSATRHHAHLDGTLLSARCMQDAERLAKAARVIGADPTGVELLRGEENAIGYENEGDGEGEEDAEGKTPKDEPDLEEDEYDFLNDSSVQGEENVMRGRKRERNNNRNNVGKDKELEEETPVLDVTEVDVARIFPRCVSHRLRVRDGPREEVLAGAVFGATFCASTAEKRGGEAGGDNSEEGYGDVYENRPTVKDILVSIMAEV